MKLIVYNTLLLIFFGSCNGQTSKKNSTSEKTPNSIELRFLNGFTLDTIKDYRVLVGKDPFNLTIDQVLNEFEEIVSDSTGIFTLNTDSLRILYGNDFDRSYLVFDKPDFAKHMFHLDSIRSDKLFTVFPQFRKGINWVNNEFLNFDSIVFHIKVNGMQINNVLLNARTHSVDMMVKVDKKFFGSFDFGDQIVLYPNDFGSIAVDYFFKDILIKRDSHQFVIAKNEPTMTYIDINY